MTKNTIFALCILATVFFVAGCASFGAPVTKSSEILDSQARKFSPPAGRAAVYVIRPYQFVAAGSPITLFIDHGDFGAIPPGSFLYGEILPREHSLEAGIKGISGVTPYQFKAEEGRCYFFYTEVNLGSVTLESISDEKGKDLVAKYKLSGQNKFDKGDEAPLNIK
jgi:hypothetical protein